MRSNILELIDGLKNNNCHYTTVDLSPYKDISYKDLIELNTTIFSNYVVGRINWNTDLPKDSHGIRDSIENKIAQNLLNYRYYPTHYEYALLSDHAYKNNSNYFDANSLDTIQDQTIQGYGLESWKAIKIFSNDDNGFYAVLYKNIKYCQMVLSYRGSEKEWRDFIDKDWQSDINSIFLNRLEGQVVDGYVAMQESFRVSSNAGYTLSFTGHSLGGWLANTNAYLALLEKKISFPKSVTFDSPGIQQFVERTTSSVYNPETKIIKDNLESYLDITTYLSYPNLVNTAHNHVGKIRFVPTDIDKQHNNAKAQISNMFKEYTYGYIDLPKFLENYFNFFYTAYGHKLSNLLNKFNPSTGYPDQVCNVKDWPSIASDNTGFYKDYIKTIVNDCANHLPIPQYLIKLPLVKKIIGTQCNILLQFLGSFALGDYKIVLYDTAGYMAINLLIGIASGDIKYEDFFEEYYTTSESLFDLGLNQTCDYQNNLSDNNKMKLLYKGKLQMEDYSTSIGIIYPDSNVPYYDFLRDVQRQPNAPRLQKLIKGVKEFAKLYDISKQSGNSYYDLEVKPSKDFEYVMQYSKRILSLYPNLEQNLTEYVNKPLKLFSSLPEYTRDSYFIGRIEERDLIDKQFSDDVRFIVISGPGGIGKSTTAAKYGDMVVERDPKVVRWIIAGEKSKLDSEFLKFAESLYPTYDFSTKKPNEIVNNIKDELVNKQCLLILDNVERYEDIRFYVEKLPGNVKFLITTRDIELGKKISSTSSGMSLLLNKGFFNMQLKPFKTDITARYVNEKLEDIVSLENRKKLIDYLGDQAIPQELKLIVTYVGNNPGTNMDEVIKLIQNGDFCEFLFDRLKEQNPVAWKMLEYSSYLDPDLLPLDIFLRLLQTDLITIQNARNDLLNQALIEKPISIDHEHDFTMHRLIQEKVRAYQDPLHVYDNTYMFKLLSNLSSVLNEEMPLFCIDIIPHKIPSLKKSALKYIGSVTAFLTAIEQRDNLVKTKEVADLLVKVSKYKSLIGAEFDEALTLSKLALSIREDVYKDSQDNQSLLNIAHSCHDIVQMNLYYSSDVQESVNVPYGD